MNLLTIDFETYYDPTYSLSKITTEHYIRSDQFEVIGVAVQVNDGEPQWFSGTQKDTWKFLQQFDWENSVALAHNAMFDMAILSWRFGIQPKKIADTLSMARAIHGTEVGGSLAALATYYGLGEKGTEVVNALGKRRIDFSVEDLSRYAGYCVNDVALTYRLFDRLVAGFPISELNLIDLTIRMFTEPVLELDKTVLGMHLFKVREAKNKLMSGIEQNKDMLMSNPQFASILRSMGVEPPTKISPTTGKETYAFSKSDEAFKALLEHESEAVQALVAARLGMKSTLEETRTQRFIEIADRGLLPIPLRYYAAHTGRWGGDDKVNMQNLPRSSPLKHAICAPSGYVMIDSDSSQIEARTLAWLAEQNDLVEAFDRGEDVYKIMASSIYGKPVADITKDERFVGKTTILGAGYGMGAAKFQAQLKNFGVDLPLEECQRIIRVYRETYPMIPLLWKQAGNALGAIANGQSAPLGRAGVLDVEGTKGIRLPNGLYIKYPNLRRWTNDAGKEELVYDTKKGKATIPNRIYGGKVVENCIAEGTEVLTDRGWVSIEDITTQDKVHDGVEFVSHGGIVYKSVQPCVNIDGVWMTSDHEVLTNDGWQAASQNPEPYRPDLRYVDGVKPRTQQREETLVEISMRLWRTVHKNWGGRNQRNKARWDTQLRVRNQAAYIQSQHQAWTVETSGVCGMAQYAGQMPSTHSQSMEELRGAWDYCVSAVAGVVRKLLAGYGPVLSARVGFEPEGQRQGVQPCKLRVGDKTCEHHEQTQHRAQGGCYGVESQNGYSPQHDLLSTGERLANRTAIESTLPEKQVYDILDAGPRSRFVVRGDKAPFIVHNCCQALARIAIGEQMLIIAKKYKVVMTVHDAIACVVPTGEAETAREFVEIAMRIRPKWAPDLPLNCESGVGRTYGEC